MGPPTKRSMTELKSISPSKCTNTRKVVFIHAGATADGTIAIIKASKEGRQDNDEPFTNPARLAIVSGMGTDAPNELVQAGFFMVASKTMNETSDIPHRTSRGYDYKVFLASVDENLTVNGFAGLKNIALRFADFMNTQKDNKYERYTLAPEWNITSMGAKPASCFILCDDAVKGIKMLFGQPLDTDNPDILNLPRNWGQQNPATIPLWFQLEKLTAAHKVELGMNGPPVYPENQLSDSSDDDNDDLSQFK